MNIKQVSVMNVLTHPLHDVAKNSGYFTKNHPINPQRPSIEHIGPERSKYFNSVNIASNESTHPHNFYSSNTQVRARLLQNQKEELKINQNDTEQVKNSKIIETFPVKRVKLEDKSNQNNQRNTKENFRVFTGTVERVIKWNKIYGGFCYYNVIASVISIQEGNVHQQKMMLLRDKKGPILQVVHYVCDYICIDGFYVGQMLRCVGHMVGQNILHAFSIRAATEDEVFTLQRMCYVCDHAIARSLSNV